MLGLEEGIARTRYNLGVTGYCVEGGDPVAACARRLKLDPTLEAAFMLGERLQRGGDGGGAFATRGHAAMPTEQPWGPDGAGDCFRFSGVVLYFAIRKPAGLGP